MNTLTMCCGAAFRRSQQILARNPELVVFRWYSCLPPVCASRKIKESVTCAPKRNFFVGRSRVASQVQRNAATWSASVAHYVDQLMNEFFAINQKLIDSEEISVADMKQLNKRRSELQPIASKFKQLHSKREEMLECAGLAVMDSNLKDDVDAELRVYRADISGLERELITAITPQDQDDRSAAMLEVKAGAGGAEASLFARELFNMYTRLAADRRWTFKVLAINESADRGHGVKDACASIHGDNVFACMKHEIGVHRVQRIPTTEALGRVHTSTVLVSILPMPENISKEVPIKPNELKVDTFKSSGPGGQSVNTTDSAVRITHLPSGIVVGSQKERSQIENRRIAMEMLSARLYDEARQERAKQRTEERRSQVGTGDRSQRIRTYNFPQDRITDHRVPITVTGVSAFLAANQSFEEVNEALRTHAQIDALGCLTTKKPTVRM